MYERGGPRMAGMFEMGHLTESERPQCFKPLAEVLCEPGHVYIEASGMTIDVRYIWIPVKRTHAIFRVQLNRS